MDPISRRTILAATAGGLALGSDAALVRAKAAGGDDPAADTAQPIRGDDGASVLGPRNLAVAAENPDLQHPPATDHGDSPNLKWSFADSHMRLEDGGWARQTTVRELPVSTSMAGVDMRLKPGAIREMHWHKEAEWQIMLKGGARISVIDEDGRSSTADIGEGDLWYFPSGLPHSIQALQDGCEFLLVFDDGAFSEDSTFLITDWFAHTPKEVLAKNFGVPESAFARIPPKELYIFQEPVPGPLATDAVADPQGGLPSPFTHRLMAQAPTPASGGTLRIVDSRNFPASRTIAAALVEVNPGAMREMHWHPNADEWQYYIEGQGRMTVFGAESRARTFDYQAGDVGYVPRSMGHFIENTGATTLRFLEMFRSDRYADVSLNQWMALTPVHLIKQHLNLDDATIAKLRKQKDFVVG